MGTKNKNKNKELGMKVRKTDDFSHVFIHHGGEFVNVEYSSYEGLVYEVRCDTDKSCYFEVVGIIKDLGYKEAITILYKDFTFETINPEDAVNLDEEDEILKPYEEIVKGTKANVDKVSESVVGGNDVEMDVVEVNDGEANGGEVKGDKVNEVELGGVKVNRAEVNDGKVNDVELTNVEGEGNDVGPIGTESFNDSDDMNFHYDNALDVAFDDSYLGSDSDGLLEDGIENMLGYCDETEGINIKRKSHQFLVYPHVNIRKMLHKTTKSGHKNQ
ncbi:hypothetical protein KIW84_025055 [Lathyrus oleraceus]|uniref:PB1-like domain-containing protein n=1 Tax=Pisum sativum TaxID=3888 RepID=A0A9D5BDA1_PEA|nr:hypothetical protein KIW84_025055 [Pisum sativum]